MDPAYWQRLQSIFDKAVELDEARRNAYVAEACGDDDGLRHDLESLLEAHTDASAQWSHSPRAPLTTGSLSGPYQNGDHIGHHQIIEQIGAGGMGIVYQAFDTRLQRHVALKFLPASLHDDEASRQRFMSEARAASRLDHPNICVIHDVDETPEGHMYITMPHYQGETLAARLKRGRVALPDTLAIAIQVADGLAAAHARDIVHRDIKPANIMLTEQGMVKLLDFGIAKMANNKLTGSGMNVGTLAYMAPEQLHGQEMDGRADIWALGVTTYEMLTGKTAFDGKGAKQIVEAVLTEDNEQSTPFSDDIPQALHAVIDRALQRDREQRHADVQSLLDELLEVQALLDAETRVTRQSSILNRGGKKVYEWDPAFIDTVVEILTPMLGPIAAKLVHRQARQAPDIESLCAVICDLFPNEQDKQHITEMITLKAAMNTTPPSPSSIRISNPSHQMELTAVQSAKLESCLLPHLGPIAGTMIRHACAAASDKDDLCRILTEGLTNPAEKDSVSKQIAAILNEQ